MKIEAVVVCKDYSDFLEHTLPENIQHLDNVVVVTHYDDKRTQRLCSKFSVECRQTAVFHENGDRFNKGRAINLGISHCRGDGLMLHIDADIVLPHRFRDMLFRAQLNPACLYGADRANVYGYDAWERNKHKLVPHYADRYFVQPPAEFPLGARIIHQEHGYVPIGYFQLWSGHLGKRYPYNQGNAEHTDVLFSTQWPRAQRILLPEVMVYHLESEPGPKPMGANWEGRKTRPFGPEAAQEHRPHYRPHRPHFHHGKK